MGCGPWGHWESDMTEGLHFHFSLSCIGEGNGNPLQCSCLENPRDSGTWWAAISGVTQSRTRLKRLSSSNSRNEFATKFHPEIKLIENFKTNITITLEEIKNTIHITLLKYNAHPETIPPTLLLLQLSRFSHVQLCATP